MNGNIEVIKGHIQEDVGFRVSQNLWVFLGSYMGIYIGVPLLGKLPNGELPSVVALGSRCRSRRFPATLWSLAFSEYEACVQHCHLRLHEMSSAA